MIVAAGLALPAVAGFAVTAEEAPLDVTAVTREATPEVPEVLPEVPEVPITTLPETVEPQSPVVTLPAEVSRSVSERAGKGGFSAYLTAAAERQLRIDALDEALARMADEHGPVDESEVLAIIQRWMG
jgi:hypothetical protein